MVPEPGVNPTITCRHADLADALVLSQFAQRAFRETYAAVNRPDDIERYLTEKFGLEQQRATLSDPAVETMLCHADERLAGYAELWMSPVPECVDAGNLLEIRRFYIDKAWHGKGIAPVLMHALFEAARAAGVNGLWLGVWEYSPRAQGFYGKCGFTRVGQHVFQLGSAAQTDFIMMHVW